MGSSKLSWEWAWQNVMLSDEKLQLALMLLFVYFAVGNKHCILIPDTWHMTDDIFGPFLSVYIRFGIGATIRTRREIQCLPYAVQMQQSLFITNNIIVAKQSGGAIYKVELFLRYFKFLSLPLSSESSLEVRFNCQS